MAKRAILTLATPLPSDDETGASAKRVELESPSRTLIERAYVQLRDDIVEGRLAPGTKLRVEHLKDRYDVGAGTLREAITRLVSDALAVAEGQRGFRVAPIALEDLEGLTQLRVHIEIDALRRSIHAGDAAWRAQAHKGFDELSAVEQPLHPKDRLRWEQLNTRFHEALIASGASAWTFKVLRLLSRHSERYRRYTIALPHRGRDVHAEHREIFERAMAGQDARAALALEAHIRTTLDVLKRAFRSL